MTNEQQRCPLCGEPVHVEPNVGAPYGLTCPGDQASERERADFRRKLADAQEVERHYGLVWACNPEAVSVLMSRRSAWQERFDKENPIERAPVTQEQLIEDINRRLPQIVAMVTARARLATIGFEPPENLRMPGKVPLRTRPLSVAAAKRVSEASDWEMFLGKNGVGR